MGRKIKILEAARKWRHTVKMAIFNLRLDWRVLAKHSDSSQPGAATKPRAIIAIACLFFILSASVLFSKIRSTPFLPDESGWISAGIYYSKLLLSLDFAPRKWDCPKCEGFGRLNPHVGKWLIGLPIIFLSDVSSSPSDREFFAFIDYSKSPEENIILGNVPDRDLLRRARATSAGVGVLCTTLAFAIAFLASESILGAAIVVALLLVNSLFVDSATRAMTDIHYSFFSLGLAAYLIRIVGKTKPLPASSVIICGVIAGLAFSVKITGIILGFGLFLTVILYRRVTLSIRGELTRSIGTFAVSCLVIIYGLNPNSWPSLRILNARDIAYETKSILADSQGHEHQGNKLDERYPQLSNLSRLLTFPQLFLIWKGRMEDQKRIFSGEFKGNRLLVIQKRLFWDFASFPLEFVFFAFGVFISGARVRAAFLDGKIDPAFIPLCYFLINYIFILLVLDVDWGRYLLPTVIASKILVAVGISNLMSLICSMLSQANSARDTA